MSINIAEEIYKLEKRLQKSVVTRWNSILTMIRSVLALSPVEFELIKMSMPSSTKQQRETKKQFDLNQEEREMLEELMDVLTLFEFASDELQSDNVTISRVYLFYYYIKTNLKKN